MTGTERGTRKMKEEIKIEEGERKNRGGREIVALLLATLQKYKFLPQLNRSIKQTE